MSLSIGRPPPSAVITSGGQLLRHGRAVAQVSSGTGGDYSCYALLHSKDVKGPASKHALVYLALDCALREMLPHARLLCRRPPSANVAARPLTTAARTLAPARVVRCGRALPCAVCHSRAE